MKFTLFAVGGLLGSAAASIHNHNKHAFFHDRRALSASASTCACSTYTEYYYGDATLVQPQYGSMTKPAATLPVPEIKTLPTPGTYTIPAKTVTVTAITTVVAPTTTVLVPGQNTVGGVTTVVTTATTVVCPYATTEVVDATVTSVIKTTTYVCPSAGTYTIAPITTSVSVSTVFVYPIPTTYAPGTYTAPEQTITVTTTDYVYVCPFTSGSSAPTQAPAPPQAPPQAPPAPPAPAPPPAEPKPTAPAAPAPPAPKPTTPAYSPPATGGTGIVTNGQQWAMTYTPYTPAGNCKSAGEVQADIALIKSKGFTTVRLYATDCSGLENVGSAAKANGVRLIIGVFINGSGIDGAKGQVSDIVNWGSRDNNWSLVVMIVVGNEAIFNNFATPESLAGFISSVKGSVKGAGFSGPVTTTEPLNILQKSAYALCAVIDVVAANVQPFFNSAVVAENAGSFVKNQIDLIGQACPGKPAYNLECGWPSKGSPNGAAIPGGAQQSAAIKDILDKAGQQSVIFSFEDDLWKDAGAFGVEKFWGCAKVF